MGDDRIVIRSYTSTGDVLEMRDAAGVLLATRPMPQAVDLRRVPGAALVLERPDTLLLWHDDATVESVPFADATIPWAIEPDGRGGWIGVASGASSGFVSIRELDATLALVRATDVPSARQSTFLLTSLADGTPLVLEQPPAGTAPIHGWSVGPSGVDAALGTRALLGLSVDIGVTSDRVWLAAYDEMGHEVLAAIDRVTASWAESFGIPRAVSIFPEAGPWYAIAARGEHLFVTWFDPSSNVHVVVYDRTGTRLGQTLIPVTPGTGPPGNGLRAGTTNAGVRLVLTNGDIIAPCDAL